MNFKLKNYTTEIHYRHSIAEIEAFLSLLGAHKVMKEYLSDGRVISLTFAINRNGKEMPFQLPANSGQVFKVLESQLKRPLQSVNRNNLQSIRARDARRTEQLKERAENVAWRILKDWLYAQLSLVEIGQAQVEQVLLPYMWNGKQTLYESMKEVDFHLPALLAPGKGKRDA